MTSLPKEIARGAIINPRDMESVEVSGCRTIPLVNMDVGSSVIKCRVIRHEPGQTFEVHAHPRSDDIMLAFQGRGEAFLGDAWFEVNEGDVVFAPAGVRHGSRNRAGGREFVCYNWEAGAPPGGDAPRSAPDQAPEIGPEGESPPAAGQGIITNVEQGALFTGYGAEMRFVLWPKNGSRKMSLHKAIHLPGTAFKEHVHPASEDMILAFRGRGEGYCFDGWRPMEQGSLLFAPRGVAHGTRLPAGGDPEPFICVGAGAPPQKDLYRVAGYM